MANADNLNGKGFDHRTTREAREMGGPLDVSAPTAEDLAGAIPTPAEWAALIADAVPTAEDLADAEYRR